MSNLVVRKAMTLTRLITLGFDQSRKQGDMLLLRCSQCESTSINGVPIHERGCPNEMGECDGCGTTVPLGRKHCKDCY